MDLVHWFLALDWPDWLNVTGYWFLDQAKDYKPPTELLDFINRGSPPVCLGFGSMTTRNPQLVTEVLIQALEWSAARNFAFRLGRIAM